MSRCKANPCCGDPAFCEVPLPQDRTGLVHLNERAIPDATNEERPPLSSLRGAVELRQRRRTESPKAWVLVPVDPTTEMVGAATRVDFDNEDEVAMTINLWHAMVAAAPPHIAADAPEFSGLPLQKLEGLIERGWQVNGYSIQKDDEIGLVTAGGLVGWFTTASKNADAAEARIKALEVQLDSKTTEFRDMVALGASADEIMRFRDGYPNPAGGSEIFYRHTIEQARYRYADAVIAARSTALKENGNG